jgi:general secretion pathway protein G
MIACVVSVLSFLFGKDSGESVATIANMNSLKTCLLSYRINAGDSLPTTAQGLKALVVRPEDRPPPEKWRQILDREPLDPWQHQFVYVCPGRRNPKSFDLYSAGPDGKPNTWDDIWPD